MGFDIIETNLCSYLIKTFLGPCSKKLNNHRCIDVYSEQMFPDSNIPLPLIDIYINPEKSQGLQRLARLKKQQLREYFQKSDMKRIYPNLFKALWFVSLPCSSVEGQERFMLKECKVGKEKMNCSEIFQKVPTDSGMCCALNINNSLRESFYTHLVEDMQDRDNAKKNKKVLKAKPGKRNGIKLTLDLHSNFQAAGSVYDDYEAFKVFVGDANEFPNMEDYGLSIEPGHEHFLSVSTTILRADHEIRGIHPKKRNCYFPDEGNLTLYKVYTFSNCMLECSKKNAESILGCVPWYLPRSHNSTMCDPWSARIFSTMMGDIDKHQCDHCLPNCQHDKISVKHNAVKFG